MISPYYQNIPREVPPPDPIRPFPIYYPPIPDPPIPQPPMITSTTSKPITIPSKNDTLAAVLHTLFLNEPNLYNLRPTTHKSRDIILLIPDKIHPKIALVRPDG